MLPSPLSLFEEERENQRQVVGRSNVAETFGSMLFCSLIGWGRVRVRRFFNRSEIL